MAKGEHKQGCGGSHSADKWAQLRYIRAVSSHSSYFTGYGKKKGKKDMKEEEREGGLQVVEQVEG